MSQIKEWDNNYIAHTYGRFPVCIVEGKGSILKDENGKICGVKVRDELAGEEFEVKAKCVVNATGVFTNEINKMDNPNVGDTIVPSQGIHLVIDRKFLPGDSALMVPKTSDGRVL